MTSRVRAVGPPDGRQSGRGTAAEERGRPALSRRRAPASTCCSRDSSFPRSVWKRLHPWSGLAILLLIAVPWHVLATLRNPPYFDFTLRSVPGEYHGFLWFYFMNEQVLRFLNLRYSARLQHRPARLLLALPSALAVSLERLFSGRRQALVQAASTAPGARACWPCAGPAFCWSFSRSPPRRSITPCRVIRRWPCCWVRRWRPGAIGCGVEPRRFQSGGLRSGCGHRHPDLEPRHRRARRHLRRLSGTPTPINSRSDTLKT